MTQYKNSKDDDSAKSITYAIRSFEFVFFFDNVCSKKDIITSTLSCSMKSKKRNGRNEQNKRSIQKKLLHQAEEKDFKNNRRGQRIFYVVTVKLLKVLAYHICVFTDFEQCA